MDRASLNQIGFAGGRLNAHCLADAYDAVASDYDGLISEDLWMRHLLWDRFASFFSAGDCVLDAACGTGLDTFFLAERGVRTTGFDVSGRMIEALMRASRRRGLADRVQAAVHDACRPLPWASGSFDGVISSFGGLNTVSDLEAFSSESSRVLKPGGVMLVHMLSPGGLWSRLRLLAGLRVSAARTRKSRRSFEKSIAGRAIVHDVRPSKDVYRASFQRHFRLRRAYGLGFLWPQHFGRRIPGGLADRMGRIEGRAGAWRPFLNWGRFFVLEMENRAAGDRSALQPDGATKKGSPIP